MLSKGLSRAGICDFECRSQLSYGKKLGKYNKTSEAHTYVYIYIFTHTYVCIVTYTIISNMICFRMCYRFLVFMDQNYFAANVFPSQFGQTPCGESLLTFVSPAGTKFFPSLNCSGGFAGLFVMASFRALERAMHGYLVLFKGLNKATQSLKGLHNAI